MIWQLATGIWELDKIRRHSKLQFSSRLYSLRSNGVTSII
ncbi:unnamed protein product [Acanthoscelides obtectus]|uniref:Uncharacterized protein n=1 Tax=Acanthoscelides obtectus TaxID=200917 RepID=A0A9P0PRI4_ACAOB|nr:unnamed protein product [Acanthoscelides obtectus]CAK1624132.1 hypothetical protein AOBTE_LOCUS2340 [Acanthoscelides obtectus]